MDFLRLIAMSKLGRANFGKSFFLLFSAIIMLAEGYISISTGDNPSAAPNHQQSQSATTTPTATATPTGSATPTLIPPTATPLPAGWDTWEPNDSMEEATAVTVNQTLKGITLSPEGDLDYFIVFAKAGQILSINTFVQSGTDTYLRLYSSARTVLAENDDKTATDLGSTIIWAATEDDWVFIEVKSAIPDYTGQYDLSIMLASPTSTPQPSPTQPPPTPAPTATPSPAPVPADNFEPNNNTGQAPEIIIGSRYEATLPGGDSDYYRLLAKPDTTYQCDTYINGVDTFLSVQQASTGEIIAENDDRSAGDVGSHVRWVSSQDGFVFVSVQNRSGQGSYTLSCNVVVPPTPNPAAYSPANTPVPTNTPAPTYTPTPELKVYYRGEIAKTSTPVSETTIQLFIVYDKNGNRAAEPDEGISQVSVHMVRGGTIVASGLTDERGEVVLRTTEAIDRVIVPYFGIEFSANRSLTRTIIVPPVVLPVRLPIEEPED